MSNKKGARSAPRKEGAGAPSKRSSNKKKRNGSAKKNKSRKRHADIFKNIV